MSADSSPLSSKEKNNLPWSNSIGKNLKKIMAEYPDRVVQKKVQGTWHWFVVQEGGDLMKAIKDEREIRKSRAGRASGGQVE